MKPELLSHSLIIWIYFKKNTLSAILFLTLIACLNTPVIAAELLAVKPVVSGEIVSIEISADIPMTYTYFKVPGRAQAVVDIAEADPEKVEPLIVVNKGSVSSISVDKVQISSMVVSRLVFNLVSESDTSVSASADRKLLTVTFGGSTAPGVPESKPVQTSESAVKFEQPARAISSAATPPTGIIKGRNPLGVDEPLTNSEATSASSVVGATTPTTAPTLPRIYKLEPVVPIATAVTSYSSSLSIKGIAAGESYIEIRANQNITDYKTTRISKPERLIIDIAATEINQKQKTISIHKFGITRARIGISPKNIRVVFDSSNSRFPRYSLSTTENGLRINFK